MKHVEASAYQNDWEYQRDRKQERKQDRERRSVRRGKTQRWNAKGADE